MITHGYENDQKFENEPNIKWRIWNIQSNTIYLISDIPTTSTLFLKGTQGYNNGVYLLDQICEEQYGNSEYNDLKARSLKVSDLINVANDTYRGKHGYYGDTPSRDYGSKSANFPTMWVISDKNEYVPFSRIKYANLFD